MLRTGVSLLALGALALASCSDDILFEPNLTDNALDASTTQLAVLSVHPWEEIAPLMKPNFELTAEQAKGSVLPTTSAFEQRILDLFTASAGIAVSSKPGREQANSQEAAKDQISPTPPNVVAYINGSGNLSEQSSLANGFKITNDSAVEGQKIVSKIPSEQDPIITHQLASALMQEVAQLNTMVERVATREGYEPYLVRMQITNMPYVRHQPYDVYANLSFFNDVLRDESGLEKRGQSVDQPLVIPLLVTDNIEGSLQSRTARLIRQFSVALDFALKGIAGNLDAVHLKDKLDAVLGVDQNSLFTIGRATDNTIQVRLGAPLNPTARYAMVPRTHNISLVVMVNRKHLIVGRDAPQMRGPQVKVYMTTEFRNATDRNNILKTSTNSDLRKLLTPLVQFLDRDESSRRSNDTALDFLQRVFVFTGENNYAGFQQYAEGGPKSRNNTGWQIIYEDKARFLWLEMAKIVSKSKNAFATFELPAPIEPKIANSLIRRIKDGSASRSDWARNACGDAWSGMADAKSIRDDDLAGDDFGPTHAVLVDTGAGTNVQIGNISGFSEDRINAVLVARNQNGERLEIPAQHAKVHKLGSGVATPDVLDLQFPHLAGLNITNIKSEGSYLRMTYGPPKWRSRNGPYRYVVCALKYASGRNGATADLGAPNIGTLVGTNLLMGSADAVIQYSGVDDLAANRLDAALELANGYRLRPKQNPAYDPDTRKLEIKFDAEVIKKVTAADADKIAKPGFFKLELILNPTYSEALRGYKPRTIPTGGITYVPG